MASERLIEAGQEFISTTTHSASQLRLNEWMNQLASRRQIHTAAEPLVCRATEIALAKRFIICSCWLIHYFRAHSYMPALTRNSLGVRKRCDKRKMHERGNVQLSGRSLFRNALHMFMSAIVICRVALEPTSETTTRVNVFIYFSLRVACSSFMSTSNKPQSLTTSTATQFKIILFF